MRRGRLRGRAASPHFFNSQRRKVGGAQFRPAADLRAIVVGLDADTIFPRETIDQLVRHFVDPRVGAVAGNAKVGNRINTLTRWQALEYVTSQNLDRRAFNLLNCITVVPGAVGAWRRELVEELGGFTPLTLAEDADLTIAIVKAGYQVLYDKEAVGLTEAPDTVRGLLRQRFRWMFGTRKRRSSIASACSIRNTARWV